MLGFFVVLLFVLPHLGWIIPLIKGRENWKFWLSIALFIDLSIVTLTNVFGVWVDASWYDSLGFGDRYWTEFWAKWLLYLSVAGIALVVWLANYAIAARFTPTELLKEGKERLVILRGRQRIRFTLVSVSVLLGAIVSQFSWMRYLVSKNASSFGTLDPVFGKDLGFYIFKLPWLEEMVMISFLLFAGLLISTVVIYFTSQIFPYSNSSSYGTFYRFRDRQKELKGYYRMFTHLAVLGILAVPIIVFHTKFAMWDLVYSQRGAVFGAGYTDVNVQIGAYKLFMWVSILSVVTFLVAVFMKSLRRTVVTFICSIGAIILFWVGGVWIYPHIIQRYEVSPNELEKERPYIERNIEFTRKAYGLDSVRVVDFPVDENVTQDVIAENHVTLESIRLWDWRVLLSNNTQHQSLRYYYRFPDVDITRYHINGKLVQVMSSARELDQDLLDENAKTFQNERFVFTHGNGICMNPVNTFLPGGMPDYWVKNIPPVSRFPELAVTEPRIYHGEVTDNSVYVHTKRAEFDYPAAGDTNISCYYSGTGGVPIGTGLKKLAFAWEFDGIRLLTSSEITSETRIMFRRSLRERAHELAPFLSYDNDPYQIIAGGRIFYIWDAYTYTDKYPYSERFDVDTLHTLNYIRNSVKVIMDAYNGTMTFVAFDPTDPILVTWMKVFPDLFTQFSEVPSSIVEHFRYPEDLMHIQAKMYAVYHMSNPNTFYNREDAWEIAHEMYDEDNSQEVLPYYVIINLPGETQEEFVQMIPFTPRTTDPGNPKHNMLAWMAARCDSANYGELIAYRFPKEKRIPGPMQIEIMINQDENISKDFTLWATRVKCPSYTSSIRVFEGFFE